MEKDLILKDIHQAIANAKHAAIVVLMLTF